MKNSKNSKSVWPVVTLSTIGIAGALALTARKLKNKRAASLENAAKLVSDVTQETKEKIDSIVQGVRSHLSAGETAGQSSLNALATDFKVKLDALADRFKNGIRTMRCGDDSPKAGEARQSAKP